MSVIRDLEQKLWQECFKISAEKKSPSFMKMIDEIKQELDYEQEIEKGRTKQPE